MIAGRRCCPRAVAALFSHSVLSSTGVITRPSVLLCTKRYFAKGKKASTTGGGNNQKNQALQDSSETKKEIEFLNKFLEAAEEAKK